MHDALSSGRDVMKTQGKSVLLALLLGVSSWWAIRYTQGPAGLSTLWPGSGILCGVLLTSPRARWPWYLAAGFAAFVLVNLTVRGLAASTFLLSLANLLDAIVVALVVSRGAGDVTDLARIRPATLFALTGTAAACLVSAGIAAATLAPQAATSFGERYLAWFASHALGMVIFATLTVVARGQRLRIFGTRGRRAEFLGELALIALVSWIVFGSGEYPLPFLVFPPLLLVVFRHRLGGFVLGTALVAVIATSEHALGHGPFPLLTTHSLLERTLALQMFVASACLMTLPVAIVLTGRDRLHRQLVRSERDYRLLADYSRDMVVRIDARGTRRYVSPSATELLGWSRNEFAASRWDLVHPDDLASVQRTLEELLASGGSSTLVFRMRHKTGHFVWIEANAVRVPGTAPGDPPEIIYSGRDVSRRVAVQDALRENERRLQAITTNLPAFVMHVDRNERYTFANVYALRALGLGQAEVIGHCVKDIVGAAAYREIEPHIRAALQGQSVSFEIEREFHGENRHFQSNFVPDVGEDGSVNGYYAVTFDITELKQAQAELQRLARHDPLTGVANRLHFVERLELALARSRRSGHPVALLYLDIDHFKQINDTLGHAAGDAVLREFARRLRESVRDVDLVARLGGDEFVVVLEEPGAVEVGRAVAKKLLESMDTPIPIEGAAPVSVGTSIGIAFSGPDAGDAESLLHKADSALYEAKRAGRNVCRVAN